MALKPVLTNVDAFDATKGTTFYFSWKGAQVSSNRLIITDSETGREVYNYKSDGMKLSHVMDLAKNDAEYKNAFVNGRQYQAILAVYSSNGNGEVNMPIGISSPITFWCFRAPSLIITNNDILNNKVPMSSMYVTLDVETDKDIEISEYDSLREYSILLYDSGHVLLSNSGPLTNKEMAYRVEGLMDQTMYSIRATGVTSHGLSLDTGFYDFTVKYISNGVGASVIAQNIGDGTIQISTNFKVTNAICNPEPPIYIGEDEYTEIDLTGHNAYVEFIDGFNIHSNFELKARLRDIRTNAFIKLENNNGDIIWIGYKVFYPDVEMKIEKHFFKVRTNATLNNIGYSKMFDSPSPGQYVNLVVSCHNGYFSVNAQLE